MMCQYCNENEAENTFLVYTADEQHEVHLCDGCAARMQMYYASALRNYQGSGAGAPRQEGRANPFPPDAGEKMKNRRKINQLRGRLQEAIEKERYEEAAQLRDRIQQAEKDVCIYES